VTPRSTRPGRRSAACVPIGERSLSCATGRTCRTPRSPRSWAAPSRPSARGCTGP
jgi:hypothetical protein